MNLPAFYFGENIPQLLTFYVPVSGGVTVGGTSPVTTTWSIYVPSGGATVGGTSPVSVVLVQTYTIDTPTGGALIGGAAAISDLLVSIVTETPSGGVAVGGTAIVSDNIPYIPTGGVNLGGEATVLERIAFIPSGGVNLGGTGSGVSVALITPAGGVAIGGTLTPVSKYTIAPSDGVYLGGSATARDNPAVVPDGGIEIGGSATFAEAYSFSETPSGGLVLGGGATISGLAVNIYDIAALDVQPQGGARLAGAATIIFTQAYTPSGGMEIGGAATVALLQPVVPVGGLQLGGRAIAFLVPSGLSVTTENPYNEDFPGWAVNLQTGSASRYLGMPANSFCRFQGRTYAANAGGIYEYGADTDAGVAIRAGIEIQQSDFGSEANKRIPDGFFLGIRCNGQMRLSVVTNKGGSRHYYAVPKTDDVMAAVRVKIGKGLEGRYWSERLENVDGADFEIESLSFTPVELSRHGR